MKFFLLILITFQIKAQIVTKPWIKAVPQGLKMSAAYMLIKNDTSKDLYLTKVKTDIAEYPELHTHSKVDGVMKMRQVKKILIKPNQTVALKPKSFHVMLIQLKRKINIGEKIKLDLIFSNGKNQSILAPVKKM